MNAVRFVVRACATIVHDFDLLMCVFVKPVIASGWRADDGIYNAHDIMFISALEIVLVGHLRRRCGSFRCG